MRILFATALDLAVESGPGLHTLAVADAWRRCGCKVTVLAARANTVPGRLVSFASADSPVPTGRSIRHWIASQVKQELANGEVELVYVRGGLGGAVRAAKEVGCTAIVELNGTLVEELRVARVRFPIRMLQLARERSALRDASGVVAVNLETGKATKKRYPFVAGKLRVIPNGCEVERFAQASLPGKNRVASSLVFVGGIHPWTRLELVIGALPEVQDATLTVIGDGKRLDELKQLAVSFGVSDRVNFFGRLPHSEIPGHMARHGIGLGNLEPDGVDAGAALKVSEYLAAGLCPITRANQSLEQIESKQLGVLLHGPVTSHSLAESLRSAIRRSELFTPEAVERRVEYARTHLSWDATARKILEFAEELRP